MIKSYLVYIHLVVYTKTINDLEPPGTSWNHLGQAGTAWNKVEPPGKGGTNFSDLGKAVN